MIALIRRSFGRAVRPLVAMGLVLTGFQVALVAAATSIAGGNGIAGLARLVPAFLQPSLGVALLSFAGITTIMFFDALVVMLVVQFAIYLASEPAGDVESGFVDLLLARPLPRHRLVTRTLIVMIASIAALAAVMVLALWIGLSTIAPRHEAWPSARVVASMTAHLAMVCICFGAASLAASAWARRRASAVGVVAVAALTFYLIDLLALIWKPVAALGRLSPFHYFHGGDILAGTANTTLDLSVLGAAAIGAIALAYWQFNRRDL